MAVNTIAPSSNTAIQQAVPTRQPEQVKPVDQPAERVAQTPPPPPPQAAVAPTVNTSGQRIGTTISTSA
ncbi:MULTISPECIES: hypothetical protein [Duganella]|jgi:hypothetical protein|uniref:Uncharacterized protein n=2 Tax=Duganella TaxID=75654 RepID=A0ABX6MG49_9BURK|nr:MULTISPECIES: hypothetical protein [Duganella]MYN25854.1 hypothetical protein [Duganella levis]QJD91907.1 hypothetical protein HH213_18500 [Duganella dendranthematis]